MHVHGSEGLSPAAARAQRAVPSTLFGNQIPEQSQHAVFRPFGRSHDFLHQPAFAVRDVGLRVLERPVERADFLVGELTELYSEKRDPNNSGRICNL